MVVVKFTYIDFDEWVTRSQAFDAETAAELQPLIDDYVTNVILADKCHSECRVVSVTRL